MFPLFSFNYTERINNSENLIQDLDFLDLKQTYTLFKNLKHT